MSFLGLDVGTTGCKAAIYSQKGELLSKSYRQNDILVNRDRFELDPVELWNSCVSVIREATGKKKGSDAVEAISICTIGEATCPVSSSGQALHNIILHIDKRGNEFTRDIEKKIGKERIYSITGQVPIYIYTIFKILWYKKYMEDLYSKVHKFLLLEDYILHRMGLDFFISHSLASRTSAFDIRKKEWSQEILESLDIDRKLFSEPVPTGYYIGSLNDSIAGSLGLRSGIKVFAGCHDFMSATLGAGVLRAGTALDNIATFEGLGIPSQDFTVNKDLLQGNISANCFIDNTYLYIGYVSSSGSALKWFRDTFCQIEMANDAGDNTDVYDLILAKIPEVPTNLLFLPHLVGSGTPLLDPYSKGAFVGITMNTKKYEVVKSILEGTSYEFKINLDLFKAAGFNISLLNATGGGAKSDKWLQIKADVYDTEINKMGDQEIGCLGLAVICARSLGIYPSYEDCVTNMVRKVKMFFPGGDRAKRYQMLYNLYRQLYASLKDINKSL